MGWEVAGRNPTWAFGPGRRVWNASHFPLTPIGLDLILPSVGPSGLTAGAGGDKAKPLLEEGMLLGIDLGSLLRGGGGEPPCYS